MSKDLTWEEFAQRLLDAGWSKDEAEAEVKRLQEEEPESEL